MSVLRTGHYTITSNAGKTIGVRTTTAPIWPILSVAPEGSIADPVFFIERLRETGRRGVTLYRMSLDAQSIAAEGQEVVVNATIPLHESHVWIIEKKAETDIYGIVQFHARGGSETYAWTLLQNAIDEKITLIQIQTTKTVPPLTLFERNQLFKIRRAVV